MNIRIYLVKNYLLRNRLAQRTGTLVYFGKNPVARCGARFFSECKSSFFKDLTARHIGVLTFNLTAKKLVELVVTVEGLSDKYKDIISVTLEAETEAYHAKKKFILTEREVTLMADKEINEINRIIAVLANKPD